jgi:hypothetical protein
MLLPGYFGQIAYNLLPHDIGTGYSGSFNAVKAGRSVDLVYLVCFVHLVSFVQPNNQTNQIDQMNKTGCRKSISVQQNIDGLDVLDKKRKPCRLFKKAVQQGRSER